MQHSSPTLVSKLLILLLRILFFFPLIPYHRLLFLAVLLRLLPPLPTPRSLSGFSNGMLEVSESGALNCSFLFGPILLTSSVPRNPILNHLPLRIAGFSNLRSDLTHPRSDILSRAATHASSGIIIFVRQSFSFTELSTSSLFLLDPYSDYVAVNISLNNSSSLSFLSVYAPYTRSSSSDGRTNSFSSSILSSSRNLFILGDFNCHCPLWDSRDTSDPREEEVFNRVISSDLLPRNPDTPTHLCRSSGSRSSPDISFAPSSLAFFC